MSSDSEMLDWLEIHAKPCMVDGEPKGLAVAIVYHLTLSLREAIAAAMKEEEHGG